MGNFKPHIITPSNAAAKGRQWFDESLDGFLLWLESKNRAESTRVAYRTDLLQFFSWLAKNNAAVDRPADIERRDLTEYLAHLGRVGLSGITRARKLAAIREYVRYLEGEQLISKSPTAGVETPKKERHIRTYLLPEEYNRMLAVSAGDIRDYCILQVFLQTGVRVSELCGLQLPDLDLDAQKVVVRGKGMVERVIDLERKAVSALRNYLLVRPQVASDHLFLNRYGEPISQRGVRKLVAKYRSQAGISKKASCHSFRHTFGTLKAEKGVSPFQLQQWLGHANLNTTQIYVHMGRQNAKKAMEATSL